MFGSSPIPRSLVGSSVRFNRGHPSNGGTRLPLYCNPFPDTARPASRSGASQFMIRPPLGTSLLRPVSMLTSVALTVGRSHGACSLAFSVVSGHTCAKVGDWLLQLSFRGLLSVHSSTARTQISHQPDLNFEGSDGFAAFAPHRLPSEGTEPVSCGSYTH